MARTSSALDPGAHWDAIYAERGAEGVSWAQGGSAHERALIARTGAGQEEPIIDVGGGTSCLAHDLIADGYRDLTVLDSSALALRLARERYGDMAARVRWLHTDLRSWRPARRYAVWHDRAVFHFMVSEADRALYTAALSSALLPGGHAIVHSFAPDGPTRCSGRPVRHDDAAALSAGLGAGLRMIDHGRESHHTPRGAEQRFIWVLLRQEG